MVRHPLLLSFYTVVGDHLENRDTIILMFVVTMPTQVFLRVYDKINSRNTAKNIST